MPGKNSRFQFVQDLNLVQNSIETASLQQSPKQESMHLLSTCQVPFRYAHKSSNGICFKVRLLMLVIDFQHLHLKAWWLFVFMARFTF